MTEISHNSLPSGSLFIQDFLLALDAGFNEFYLSEPGKPVKELYVAGKKSVVVDKQNLEKSHVNVIAWDDEKGKYEQNLMIKMFDTNLLIVQGNKSKAFLFRRFSKAREYSGAEFTGEYKVPPAPTKNFKTFTQHKNDMKKQVQKALSGGTQLVKSPNATKSPTFLEMFKVILFGVPKNKSA